MVKDFTNLNEGNIPETQLLCLPLLYFWYICLLALACRPEVGSSCEFPHCSAKFYGFRGKGDGGCKHGEPFAELPSYSPSCMISVVSVEAGQRCVRHPV
jgi:hypothetical protein